MAYTSKLLVILLVCFLALSSMAKGRDLASKTDLVKRVKLAEEASTSCFESLFELQSCTSEVVLFFLNGETQLGSNCCRAIITIEKQCWPSMLGSIGVTTEEAAILRGYCDASAEFNPVPPPAIPNVPAIQVSSP